MTRQSSSLRADAQLLFWDQVASHLMTGAQDSQEQVLCAYLLPRKGPNRILNPMRNYKR